MSSKMFYALCTILLCIWVWWFVGVFGAGILCWCFDWEYSMKVSTGIWLCATVIFLVLRALRRGD